MMTYAKRHATIQGILWAMMLCMTALHTQAAQTFKIIDNHMGLKSNTINSMAYDKQGFAWLCTPDGLCRYDGITFGTYIHTPNNPYSIANNDIHLISPDNHGLWIGAGKTLQYYDYNTGRFETQQFQPKTGILTAINKERLQSILRMGNHLFAVDYTGKMYGKKDGEMFFTILQEGVYALCRYNKSTMVGLKKDGIYLLSADGRKVMGKCKMSLPISWKSFLYYSHNKRLLYYGNGIGFGSMAFQIRGNHIQPARNTLLPHNLMAAVDYQGGIAFGLDGDGILIEKGKDIEAYNTKNSNLSNDAIFSLAVSPQNTLWIGTYRGGLNIMDEAYEPFTMLTRQHGDISYDIVTAVMPIGDNIYMGLDGGGLCIYNKVTKQSKTLTTANSGLPDNHIIGLLYSNQKLWLAVYTKGLIELDLRTQQITQHPIPRKHTTGNDIWSFCKDEDGNIWVGGYDLMVFDTKTKRYATTKPFQGIDCASIISHGRDIWVGTNDHGLYRIDAKSKRIVSHYSMLAKTTTQPIDQLRCIYRDRSGQIWLATLSNGLYTLNPKTQEIKKQGEEQGLGAPQVASMNEDMAGNIWMGTFNGLYRYHPATRSFMRMDRDEDIASTFTYGASVARGDTIYMGSTKGLLVLRPSQVRTHQGFKQVTLNSLDLMSGDQESINLYGTDSQQLKLEHDQNFFTLRFSVPEYDTPNRIHFSCMLKGLEEDWRELGEKREVAYTNVPPGCYEFLVRCTGEDGQWISPTVLKLHIASPWYATWWAYILWSIIVLGIIIAILKTYLHEMDIKHKIQIVEMQRKTRKKLNEAKMDFYARATHELRTPVFLIGAQIEELMNMPQPVTIPLSFLNSMSRNSKKLNNIISRVIDMRKMDKAGTGITLNLQHLDLVAFCRNLTEDYQELCSQKHIDYQLMTAEEHIMLDFDQDKLETIITNLISNAFKYTNIGGKVTLRIQNEADRVELSVSDNGIGILENMRESIFENYFRTKRGEQQSSGDGIGLATVKQLVEQHHGKIKVESEVDHGSTFTFFIPKNLAEDKQGDLKETNKPKEEERTTVPTTAASNPTATHSILIIDDEHDTIEILERNLCADFKVMKAYDGKEGLKIAQEELPDIIVTDLMMPNMDGIQFLKTLKEDKKLQHIKVIIFTAKTAEEDMVEAFDNGADAYLTKPISMRLLRKRIDRLIEQGENAQIAADITNNGKNNYSKEEQLFLLRCREIIDENLQNEDFNIEVISDTMAMSHSSLYKKIKGITGMSLIEFINDYKIYKAVEMFRQGATNVDTVREKCGFSDAKNFRTIFKRKKGVTPKQFIQGLYQQQDN